MLILSKVEYSIIEQLMVQKRSLVELIEILRNDYSEAEVRETAWHMMHRQLIKPDVQWRLEYIGAPLCNAIVS